MLTPEQWLPVLAKRMDNNAPRVRLLKSYMDGNAPLPSAGKNAQEAWIEFQKESRTNWGQLILEAVTDRIVTKGILVAGDSKSDVARQAQRIWRDNRMDHVFEEWLRFGLTFAQSYLTVWSGADGRAVVKADSPETMVVAADPLQPWRVRAALRCWRDIDRERDYALVWSEDAYQIFGRPSKINDSNQTPVLQGMVQGKWDPDPSTLLPVPTASAPPVVVYNNPGGQGEYEPHIDVINRINKGVLRRLCIEAMQAFRQQALESAEGSSGLPQKDEHGNDIDWSEIFSPHPAALWDLPPGVKIWESATTDITPLLAGSKDDIRHLSAVSRTPLPILMPDNTNTSAAGAIATETGYISKCGKRLAEAKLGGEALLVKALELEGVEGLEGLTVDLQFESVERVSLIEKYQAASQAVSVQSRRSIQRDILGWGPDEIAQDALDSADEMLRTLLMQPQTQPQQQRVMAPGDGSGSGRPR